VRPDLSLSEWIVLAAVDREPGHGFAIASLTGPDGLIGKVWTVPRPIVYRSIDRLLDLGLVKVVGTEPSSRGPQRTVMRTTPAGGRAVRAWLQNPVGHVRDMRSEFLVKLALLDWRGADSTALAAAQRTALLPTQRVLAQQARESEGFAKVLSAWRVENVDAALRFLDSIGADHSG
jgi:PadR family transcriptional regulator AphA